MSTSHVNKPYMTNEHSARHTPTHSAHATFGRARCRRPQKLWRFWARPVCRRRARLECWGPRLLPPRCCRCCRCLPLLQCSAAPAPCVAVAPGRLVALGRLVWQVSVRHLLCVSSPKASPKGSQRHLGALPAHLLQALLLQALLLQAAQAHLQQAHLQQAHLRLPHPRGTSLPQLLPPPGCSVCALDSRAPLPAGAAGAAAGGAAAG